MPDDVTIAAEYVPDTSVLRITATSDDPAEAQAVVNAYAKGFAGWRKGKAVDQYEKAAQIINEKISAFDERPQQADRPRLSAA